MRAQRELVSVNFHECVLINRHMCLKTVLEIPINKEQDVWFWKYTCAHILYCSSYSLGSVLI